MRIGAFFWELAGLLGLSLEWLDPQQIFLGLAQTEAPFAGLSYEAVGDQGAQITPASSVSGARTEAAAP